MPTPTAFGWAQVAAASEQAEKAQGGEEPTLVKGDYVEHRQFGLCRVDGEDPDGALILRLPSGNRKHIRLDFLEVLPPRQDGERRIYPLRPRKR